MNTINVREIEMIDFPKRSIQVLLGMNSPLKSNYMTFGITTINPYIKMDPHVHKREEEIIFILV